MSFFIDPAVASNGAARGLLHTKSLKGMAIALGVTATAIIVTAGHQIAAEEGRNLLNRMRGSHSMRRERNNAVLCALIAADDIPPDMISFLEGQRDVFRAAIRLSLNKDVPEEARLALRNALREMYAASHAHAT